MDKIETFKPVEVSDFYINQVSKGMERYFWEYIFKPIFDILKENTIINSKDDVINALKSGKIYYKNGAFWSRGRFTNDVAKALEDAGAKYKFGAYFLDKKSMPFEYFNTIGMVEAQSAAKTASVFTFLNKVTETLGNIKFETFIEKAVTGMFKKLQKDIFQSAEEKKVPVIELTFTKPVIDIPKEKLKEVESHWAEYDKRLDELRKKQKKEKSPAIQEEINRLNKEAFATSPNVEIDVKELDWQSRKIAEDYTYNMKYWVKKWEAKNIIKMRQDVLEMVRKGQRVPDIQEYFEKRWNIAKDKAHFLAENESHLAASTIKATEYQRLGAKRFRWGRSSSREKRKLHELYYNEIFDFDNPPVIDEKLNIKGLPRQIWNCKCHILAVVPTISEIQEQRQKIKNAKRNIIKYVQYSIENSKQCNNPTWRYRRFR